MANHPVMSLTHTFEVASESEAVVKVHRPMAEKIIKDGAYAQEVLDRCTPQDPRDGVNLRELELFLEFKVWPEHYIFRQYLRTYANVGELQKAARDYIAKHGGPG